jgi:hypothetical protein
MADITKCKGLDCEQKHNCWRFTAPAAEVYQSYFMTDPNKTPNNCDKFWNNITKIEWEK